MNLSSRTEKAFTLLEMVMAMALLVLLVGGLFGVVHSSMRAASTLHQQQNRGREISALLEMCRKTFRTLPASASIEMREAGGDSQAELILHHAPGAFAWTETFTSLDDAVLSVKPQPGGRVRLILSREQTSSGTESSPDATRSVMLIPDLMNVSWRFYDGRTGAWQPEWKDAATHPLLVELTLSVAGEDKPRTAEFWLPPLTRATP